MRRALTLIDIIAETIGYMSMDENTEVIVFDDGILTVAVPDVCDTLDEIDGVHMTAGELEESLSFYEIEEFCGGYNKHTRARCIQLEDAGIVTMYGIPASAVIF